MKVTEVTLEYLVEEVFKNYQAVDSIKNQLKSIASELKNKNKLDPRVDDVVNKASLAEACHQAYCFLVRGESTRPDPMTASQRLMFEMVTAKLNKKEVKHESDTESL